MYGTEGLVCGRHVLNTSSPITLHGVSISMGYKLQTEVGEFLWRDVQLDGSLLIVAKNVMGSTVVNKNGETVLQHGKRNVEARGKRKWESRNGSKSIAHHHIARGVDLEAPIGQIETWHIRHWHSERGWISPQAEAKYVNPAQWVLI